MMEKVEKQTSTSRGRELVSSTDLRAGDCVLSEIAFAVALRSIEHNTSFCFYCCSLLSELKSVCSHCLYTFCSDACKNSNAHKLECPYLKSIEEYSNIASIIFSKSVLVLRTAINSLQDKDNFEKIQQLTTHKQVRDTSPIAALAYQFSDYLPSGVVLNVDEIVDLFCIIDINSFGLSLDPTAQPHATGIFPVASFFSHSCTPNIYYTTITPNTLQFYALQDIKKNEPLFISYIDIMYPTWQRQQTLVRTKHFLCTCERCTDPSEQKRYISALRCTCKGYVLPHPAPIEPHFQHKNFVYPVSWICENRCNNSETFLATNDAVQIALEFLYSEMWREYPEKCVVKIKSMVEPLLDKVHPNHTLNLNYHLANANSYGKLKQYQKAVEHAEAVCELATKLFPPNFGEISQYFNMLGMYYEEIANMGTEKQKRIHAELAKEAYLQAQKVAIVSCGASSDWAIQLGEAVARVKAVELQRDQGKQPIDVIAELSETIPLRSSTGEQVRRIAVGAASKGNAARLVATIRKDPSSINFADEFGRFPLHYAVLKGNLECVQILLENGANVNTGDANKLTPLHYAASTHQITFIRLLRKFGADINHHISGNTPLGNCAGGEESANLLECVKFLLEEGADPNIGSPFFPIHNISIDGNVEALSLLVDHGAQIDAQDAQYGNTALHYAVMGNHIRAVEYLLQKNAKILPNKERITPPQLAESERFEDICKLFTSGKNKNSCSFCGITAVTRCSACRMAYYCSQDHQRKDWPKHKLSCKK
eukprot:Phypoly_transcript_03840.p1 GENE.Phypoly_transcript_03840~~Phypoly_transcript_03840.p1  ORF type:complete len:767 (+),score=95.81 Phypoly_transcript_03840:20-2320(+)